MISIIVAVAENNVIGNNNELLWHLSEDLKRFKRITRGHTVVMGRNTYLSLPKRPLPDRRNIVISDRKEETFEGCVMTSSVNEVLEKCKHEEEVFVIGGGMVYKQFMDIADKLYITRVHKAFEGDTCFPDILYEKWKLVDKQENLTDLNNNLTYSFLTYIRK